MIRVDGNGGKPLLKALLQRFVPAELFQRPKHGFTPPLQVWFGCGPTSAWADPLSARPVRRGAVGWP